MTLTTAIRPNGGYVIDSRGRIWCGDCPNPRDDSRNPNRENR